jgi:hypothetical protein
MMIRRLTLFFLLCTVSVHAQTRTSIRDTLYNADGSRAAGQIEITWNGFRSADGKTIAAGKTTRRITDGVLDLALVPNAGTTPAGTSYAVTYLLASGLSYSETWVVPQSDTPVSLAAVRASVTPAPPVQVGQQQLSEGGGLQVLLDFYRAASATATRAGQCYWNTTANALYCATGAGTWQSYAPGTPASHAGTHASNGADPLGINASQITSGTLADSLLPATIAGNKTFNGSVGVVGDIRAKVGGTDLGPESYAQPTFTPSHTKWLLNEGVDGDFTFFGDVLTYLATVTGWGDLYQEPADLAVAMEANNPYRFEWTLQNVTTGDLACDIWGEGDTPLGTIALAAGTSHVDFTFLPGFPPYVICSGSTGGFEVVSVSLKEMPSGNLRVDKDLYVAGNLNLLGSINAPVISAVRYAQQFPGPNAGAKIAAAIADLPVTGGTVDARGFEGAQTITSTIVIHANTILECGGANATFNYTGAGDAVQLGPGTGVLADMHSAIRGCWITTSTGAVGIRVKDSIEWELSNNIVSGFSTAGIALDATGGQANIVGRIQGNVVRANSGDGIRTTGANSHNQLSIMGNYFAGNTGYGLNFAACSKSLFIGGNDLEGNGAGQVALNCSEAFVFSGNHMETNAAPAGWISFNLDPTIGGSNSSGTITGNSCYNNLAPGTTTCFKLYGATISAASVTLLDNVISGWNIGVDPGTAAQVLVGPNKFSRNTTDVVLSTNLVYFAATATLNLGVSNAGTLALGSRLAVQGPIAVADSSSRMIQLVPNNGGVNQISSTYYGGASFLPLAFYTNNVERLQINAGSATIDVLGTFSKYNSIATVANGVPAEYGLADLTGQTAAKAATTLYAVPAAGAGIYRISWVAKVTTAATTSSVLGGTNGFQVTYTDADDSVVVTPLAVPNGVATGNTTATQLSGVVIVNAKASTNIQYQFDYTSVGVTPMAYSLHVRLEAM